MVQLYYPLVYNWCCRAELPAHDIVDVTQEVFWGVARGLNTFRRDRPGDTFRGWLRGITRHKLQDYWRRRIREDRGAGGSDAHRKLTQLPDPVEADDEQVETGAIAHRALQLIRLEFSEQTWQAFWRVAVDDQPAAEVAEELGMTRNAVYKAKSRVIQRLREQLGDIQ